MSLMARRNWALRLSIVLNVCVLLYVCAHLTSSGPWIDETPNNWANSGNVAVPLAEAYGSADNIPTNASQRTTKAHGNYGQSKSTKETNEKNGGGGGGGDGVGHVTAEKAKRFDDTPSSSALSGSSRDRNEKINAANPNNGERTRKLGNIATIVSRGINKSGLTTNARNNGTMVVSSGKQLKTTTTKTMTMRDAIICNEKSSEPRRAQRGDYWVLYNYAPMKAKVKCWESVTYTTHADYTFLDNLEPLIKRWRAPISIALHAPGNDFLPTLNSIKYARNCLNPLVAQYVTFHVYFSSKHVPKMVPDSGKVIAATYNCSLAAPWANVTVAKMYKSEKKLLYPVNVGRNIARESATTHFVLASDIELYPSPNLPSTFLDMIRRRDQPVLHKSNPKVFVLSIFEVDEKSTPPNNKTVLMTMLKNGSAIPFHKKLCSGCHNVPRSTEWQETPQSAALKVFHVGKRIGKFIHWEPIFIGTNADPMYDERLSWEGKSDKMTQGYALCVLDYDFLILDNAFLVHRPGIKILKKDLHRDKLTAKTNSLIKKIIVPELQIMYGIKKGCAV